MYDERKRVLDRGEDNVANEQGYSCQYGAVAAVWDYDGIEDDCQYPQR